MRLDETQLTMSPSATAPDAGAVQRAACNFWVPLALFLVLNWLLRLLIPRGLSTDEAEQVVLGQALAWGYGTQPPVYTWLVWFVFQVTGPGYAGVSMVANFLLGVTAYFLFASTRMISRNGRIAALCGHSLVLCPLLVMGPVGALTHSILAGTLSAATAYVILRIFRSGHWTWYVALGVAIAMGMLAKYNYAIVVVALVGGAVAVPSLRRRLRLARLMTSIVIAALIVAPHAIWAAQDLDGITSHVAERGEIDAASSYGAGFVQGLLRATGRGLWAATPIAVAYLVLFAQARRAPNGRGRVYSQWLMWSFILAAVMLLLVMSLGITTIEARWLIPVIVLVPSYLSCRLGAGDVAPLRLTIAGYLLIGCGATVLAARSVQAAFGHLAPARHAHQAVDYRDHAEQIVAAGYAGGGIVAGDFVTGGNLRVCFPNAPVLCLQAPRLEGAQQAREADWLIVWDATCDRAPPAGLASFVHERLGRALPAAATAHFSEARQRDPQGSVHRLGFLLLPGAKVDLHEMDGSD